MKSYPDIHTRRIFYRSVIIGSLGITETISWGHAHSFVSVLILPMHKDSVQIGSRVLMPSLAPLGCSASIGHDESRWGCLIGMGRTGSLSNDMESNRRRRRNPCSIPGGLP